VIVLVGHQKGGVGKSTVAVNLAAELQRRGKDLCIVEADPSVYTTSVWALDREMSGAPPIFTLRRTGDLSAELLSLAERHDVVLVDAAGKDSQEMRSALTVCDLLVAPIQPSQPDLDATERLVKLVTGARGFNDSLKVMGVLNRVATNVFNRGAAQAREYLAKYPEIPLAETKLHERLVYQTSLSEGLGVVEMRDSKAKAEIQLLAQEVLTW
jgi:chromosome partitioning protein